MPKKLIYCPACNGTGLNIKHPDCPRCTKCRGQGGFLAEVPEVPSVTFMDEDPML